MKTTFRKPAALLAAVMSLLALAIGAPMQASAAPLPKELVNGDFEYPKVQWGYNMVTPHSAKVLNWNGDNITAGFDWAKFGWKGDTDQATIEIDRGNDMFGYYNQKAALAVPTMDVSKRVYQDIDTSSTEPTIYRVDLDFATGFYGDGDLNLLNTSSMQVLIGTPGHEQPVSLTRTTSNGYGDKVGVSGTTITTTGKAWYPYEHYMGLVPIPANQPVTRFSYQMTYSSKYGGELDNVAFQRSYLLKYDANGGTKHPGSKI